MHPRFTSCALGALAAALLASISVAGPAQAAVPARSASGSVTAWATALQSIPDMANPPPLYRTPDVAGRTVRQIVYPTVSGRGVRIRVSNVYGRGPLTLIDVALAQSAGGAATRPGTAVRMTFGGKPSVTLKPGAEVDSDWVQADLTAGEPYAISLTAGPRQTMTAWHRVANQVNYVSTEGDHAADTTSNAFLRKFTESAWVSGIDVRAPNAAAVAAIGDSITDGLRSSLNRNHRWPDAFARRLAQAGSTQTAVLNLGISGNRLLSDSPCYGEALDRRFDRDALGHAGVGAVILLIGINDINFASMPPRTGLDCDFPHTSVTARDLTDGYRRLIERAHRDGVRIYGATLTPASLPPAREAIRTAVNEWIRTSRAFDGVVDFDAALRDPAHPDRLQRRLDSGDHIHPNDEGYAAMAAAVPLQAIATAAHR
ncbi:SGNH/GDSL hydrolase family protein [Trinickia dinghuensis]|uniref:SGNH/GDSL hydrolase family protein n=1 Tax=Trinickia dinghuensis TaxID=2291023 RepID=A0A3D8JZG7_9BURK|nr:SGNH/GDSL hydrolase family protein [Trinickia dinghuensis]RDU98280.1 SGNH/GDSL hydrolase family protein [Trinickia dinghuensis]